MKKKIFVLTCLLIMGGLSVFFFGACDKDTTCYVQVTVIDEDNNEPVAGAKVKIDMDSSYIKSEGVTNANGIFETSFTAPAIFNVVATYETGYDEIYDSTIFYCYRKGTNTVHLKEGEVVKSVVTLESAIIREHRQ